MHLKITGTIWAAAAPQDGNILESHMLEAALLHRIANERSRAAGVGVRPGQRI